ncbi:MerR family transcriptional regulator [Saccharomonospora sp. NPDC046836]|uniref:MerR family transcriptional regulator n=1 Tax=Saccharomonospora sp. NPDC046836 TaxID=3156921 RepID=UPI00340C30AD
MAELSRESGVAIATIKYYQREGLLPPGERTGPNQARYDQSHVQRLKLVRALLEVGGLSVAAVRDVVDEIDERNSTHNVLGVAQYSLPLRQVEVDDEARAWAMKQLAVVAEERDWRLLPGTPPTEALVSVLCSFRELGHARLLTVLDRYADVADRIAEADLDSVAGLDSTEAIVESAVVGTVLGDVLLAALRRLAQGAASRRRFADKTATS